jgi:hypothetical protein
LKQAGKADLKGIKTTKKLQRTRGKTDRAAK